MKNAIFRPKMAIFDQKTGLNVLNFAFSPKFPTVVSNNRFFVTLWHELDLSICWWKLVEPSLRVQMSHFGHFLKFLRFYRVFLASLDPKVGVFLDF